MSRSPQRGRPARWLAVGLLAAALVALVIWQLPEPPASQYVGARFVYLVGLLALVAAGLLGARRLGLGAAVRYALVWIAIGLALVLAYAFLAPSP